MDKKYLINTALLFVAWMLGSYVVHGALLQQDYLAVPQLFRTPEESQQYFHWMLLSHMFLAGALVWLYRAGVEAKGWIAQGLRFGIAVAFLTVVPTYTIYYVVQPMPGMHALKQIAFDGVLLLLLSLLVAFLYRKGR